MKYYSFIMIIFFCLSGLSCQTEPVQQNTVQDAYTEILPLRFTLLGSMEELLDHVHSRPPVHFNISKDTVKVVVGFNEVYNLAYEETDFAPILKRFTIQDFNKNGYFYNSYLKGGGYIMTSKTINETNYTQTISNYRRSDLGVTYQDLDPVALLKFNRLANYAYRLGVSLLVDRVDPDTMITANSMKEALLQPEKVYKLNLRNTRTNYLSPNIGKLINLRLLDISGSFITAIPPEIENCTELRTILANASKLRVIPASISNLKKLRDINFAACDIRSLPAEMGNLSSLWRLSLGDNQLSELPESFSQLKNVTFFSVANNNFSRFPTVVMELESVLNLWMHGNSFTTIPTGLSRLTQMTHFLVDANELENLDAIKQEIPKVRIIDQNE